MIFGRQNWESFEAGTKKEWIITNGIGGFASSSLIGANTRRYHGLLIASLEPPIKKHLVLSKLEESIEIRGNEVNLSNNEGLDFVSDNTSYLQTFNMAPFPCYTYSVEDVLIEKNIFMVNKENKVVILYKIITNNNPIKLKLMPLINFRNFHGDSTMPFMDFKTTLNENSVNIIPFNNEAHTIYIKASEGVFTQTKNWWYFNMKYNKEEERGLNCVEDHYIPGYFEVNIDANQVKTVTIIASMKDFENIDGEKLLKKEVARINKFVTIAGLNDEFANRLVRDADNFIVDRKSTKAKTIIAGYHWFEDWGRDAMIAFPGITLATKRYDDAKSVLLTFSKYIKNGLLPNTFPSENQEPLYNTVDASLWYFEAIYQYAKQTKDYEFIRKNLYDGMKEIITQYILGADYGIKMDEDGLIMQGSKEHQLTWMDAKVGQYVVTPRNGKSVEINALWYNALKVMEYISKQIGESFDKKFSHAYDVVKTAFEEKFWNQKDECLYDYINEKEKNAQIRPNQIIAVSLSFPVIEGEKAKKIVEKVWQELYIDYGIRTLNKGDKEYKGIYIGNQYDRDTAYHQGTAWTWLIGHFIIAYLKVNKYSKQSKEIALKLLEPFKTHIDDAAIGSISEIFDGDAPYTSRGAVAQAWSVGEVLRAYLEASK